MAKCVVQILNWEPRGGPVEIRHLNKEGEVVSHVDVLENISGRQNSKCKGPEAGAGLTHFLFLRG